MASPLVSRQTKSQALEIKTPTTSLPNSTEVTPTQTTAPEPLVSAADTTPAASAAEHAHQPQAAPVPAPAQSVASPSSPTPEPAVSEDATLTVAADSAALATPDEDEVSAAGLEDEGTAAEEVVARPQDRSPRYEPDTWSPSNPTGQKKYSAEFLMLFKPLAMRPVPRDGLSQEQLRLLSELQGNGSTDGAGSASQRGGGRSSSGGGRSTRSSVSSGPNVSRGVVTMGTSGGVSNLAFVPQTVRKPKATVIIPGRQEKLERGDKAWSAKSTGKGKPEEGDVLSETLNKAQAILNKLTVEKFEKLSDELLALGVQLSEEQLQQFVEKIFQKVPSPKPVWRRCAIPVRP
jgi:hypothetical protein